MVDAAKVLQYVFLLLIDNQDLGVTDPLPSICASLTKAMVHYLHVRCWTLEFCTCDFITDRPIVS